MLRLKSLCLTLIVPLISLTFSNCRKQASQAKNASPQTYEVLKLIPQDVEIYSEYPAKLEGQEVVEIQPKVEGYLDAVYVNEGDRVKRGQLLFRIKSPEYEEAFRSAKANVHMVEAQVATAEMDVRKTKPLVEKDIISKYELESAELTLKSQKAALAVARATLANAWANLAYTSIVSPANGVIGTIPYKKGALVGSSTATSALTTLAVDKSVYAYFALNEKQLLDFNRNMSGKTIHEKLRNIQKVALILADGSIYPYEGTMQSASGIVDTETGSSSFKAEFPNSEFLLNSGASATIRIPYTAKRAIVIPQSATYEMQDKVMVYVLQKGNQVISKPVNVQGTSNGLFYVVRSGLSVSDQIVTNGLASLKDSLSITPVSINPTTVYSKLK